MGYAEMSNEDINREIARRLGYGTYIRVEPGQPAWVELPQWSTDLNAAWALSSDLLDGIYMYLTTGRNKTNRVRIVDSNLGVDSAVPQAVVIDHESPARAICEAWLLWQDKH